MNEQLADLTRRLHSFMLKQGEASFSIILLEDEEWSVSLEFGKEGGASHQQGPQLIPCLQRLVEEVGA